MTIKTDAGLAPSTSGWHLDTDTGSMTPRSALEVLGDLNERVTTGHLAEYQPVPLGFTPLDKTIGLGLPVVLLGFAQPHENAHAPDEWMDLANYEGAIRAIVATFDEMAKPDGGASE